MKYTLYFVLLAAATVLGEHDCGKQTVPNNLDAGSSAKVGEFPWLVRLLYKDDQGQIMNTFCSGSLISEKYVLTSAVCTTPLKGVLFKAVLGEHDITSDKDCDDCELQEIEVENIITHEYDQRTRINDIALLKLKTNAKFTDYVQPICLPWEEQANVGDTVATSGWGRTETERTSHLKKKVISTIIDIEECRQKFKNTVSLDGEHMCTKVLESSKDVTCSGDAGAPIVFLKNDKWYQQGIVSFGPAGCGRVLPEVGTIVKKYTDWVKQNMV